MSLVVLALATVDGAWTDIFSSLPGGYSKGDQLFYTGATTFSISRAGMSSDYWTTFLMTSLQNGQLSAPIPLTRGMECTVVGPSNAEGVGACDECLAMEFPMMFGSVLNIKVEELSREKPPPHPDATWRAAKLMMMMFGALILVIAVMTFLLWITLRNDDNSGDGEETDTDLSSSSNSSTNSAAHDKKTK